MLYARDAVVFRLFIVSIVCLLLCLVVDGERVMGWFDEVGASDME